MQREIARPPEELETWVNATRGSVVLQRFGETGRIIDVMVQGGRKVNLSPRERRHNSELAADDTLDFFQNGTMQPVKLLDGESGNVEIAENPNLLGETEMRSLIGGHWKTFDKRVADVTSPTVLHRLLDLAKNPDNGATVRTMETIKERLNAVEGEAVGGPDMDEIEDLGQIGGGIGE